MPFDYTAYPRPAQTTFAAVLNSLYLSHSYIDCILFRRRFPLSRKRKPRRITGKIFGSDEISLQPYNIQRIAHISYLILGMRAQEEDVEEENSQLRCVVQMPKKEQQRSSSVHIYLAHKASKKEATAQESMESKAPKIHRPAVYFNKELGEVQRRRGRKSKRNLAKVEKNRARSHLNPVKLIEREEKG
ncbi:hypothetical protein TSAR_000749 [Trichomalopsis sarcophagae]|uniref:Uncharacterized protein n=1 Tax=Trichomalopsis sarcophagae TaxID=543379 RepID=A0A232EKK2_9HYME|nr:hypothetical protein TSAR_000749 [Trichomalopsis sarcophagae]